MNLTPLMVDTLLQACDKQCRHIPFGPGDIKGSVIALINRGLIVQKKSTGLGPGESTWQVTKEAVQMLETIGILVKC